MPKTVDTGRHSEEDGEHATIFRNPLPTSWFLGCGRLLHALTPPHSALLYHKGAIAPLYIGMTRVGQHRSHTFGKSTFPWQ